MRILATRFGSKDVESEVFDRALAPELPAASLPLSVCWNELDAFCGASPVLVPALTEFDAWRTHAGGHVSSSSAGRIVLGVRELEGLLLPGEVPLDTDSIAERVDGRRLQPEHVREHAAEIVARFLGQSPEALDLAASGYLRAWRSLQVGSPLAARILRLALALADRPLEWTGESCSGFSAARTGAFTSAVRDGDSPGELADRAIAGCERESERWTNLDTVPVECDMPAPLEARDLERLDEVFRVHLPASFAVRAEGETRPSYREGQHETARAIGAMLGTGELRLVHAPTGTGKTLAYLVPALLWASRHGTRVGVATYTRALQQQAMDREMPRALAALASAGLAPAPRVSMLKGRENYLCWRALKLAVPDEDDDGESWLAWTSLALFGLRDAEGDLDRLPLRPPIPLESSAAWRRRLDDMLRGVRSRNACCVNESDKRSCGAENARRRAERSHLVITNQAFALARPEFFKHIVFDECEHLHDQALAAWSHVLTFRQMRATLNRLHAPGRSGSVAALDRMRRAVLQGTPMGRVIEASLLAWVEVAGALARLESELEGFETWRDEASRTRSEREVHSLLREYVERDEAAGLVEARRELARGLNTLESALTEISERLDATPLRGLPSLRRALDLARTELSGILETVAAWLPLVEGRPAYRASHFYDLEVDARGERAIAARVLLPNEVLGRDYYPQLATAVFVSATRPRPRRRAGAGRGPTAADREDDSRSRGLRLLASPRRRAARRATRRPRQGRLPRLRASLHRAPRRAHARTDARPLHECAGHAARRRGARRILPGPEHRTVVPEHGERHQGGAVGPLPQPRGLGPARGRYLLVRG